MKWAAYVGGMYPRHSANGFRANEVPMQRTPLGRKTTGGKSGRTEAPALYHDEITPHLTQLASGSVLEGDAPASVSCTPSSIHHHPPAS